MRHLITTVATTLVLSLGCQDNHTQEIPGDNTDAATENSRDNEHDKDTEITTERDESDNQEWEDTHHDDTDDDDTQSEHDTKTDPDTDSTSPEEDTDSDEGNPTITPEDPDMVIDYAKKTIFVPIEGDNPVFINAITRDTNNRIIVGGNTWGDLYGKNTFFGVNDAVCAQFNDAGQLTKNLQFGSQGMEIVNGVLHDKSGNSYLTGRTAGALQTHFGMEDFFATKIDSNLNRKWTSQFGLTDPGTDFSIIEDIAHASTIDGDGNIYMGGTTDANGTIDGLIVKLDSKGNTEWNTVVSSDALSIDIWSMVAGKNNAVYVTGMAGYPGSHNIDYDVFVAAFNRNSSKRIFYREWGEQNTFDSGKSIAVDSQGTLYIAGQSQGQLILLKIGGNGAVLEEKFYPLLAPWAEPRAIVIDQNDDIYIAGTMKENNNNQGAADLFIIKVENSPSLPILWTLSGGTDHDDMVNGLTLGNNDKLYAAGSYKWDLVNFKNPTSNGFLLVVNQ